MFNNFVIYIRNTDELIECQNKLFEKGYKWKNLKVNKIHRFKTPIYLFVIDNIITWSDDNFIALNSAPIFSYKEYLKFI